MTQPKLIALYSPAPGSGKSEVAKVLEAKGYTVSKFAHPLKDMLVMLLMHAGYSIEDARRCVDGDLKEFPLAGPFFGKTPRELMQTLGTEWGRKLIDPHVWTNLMADKVNRAATPMVVDDMRFPNEYDTMKFCGAILVKVTRPGAIPRNTHPSEGLLEDKAFDLVLDNSGSLRALKKAVYEGIKGL